MFCVSVASTVPLDLLDVENDEAMCARSEPDVTSGTAALATYRMQEGKSRAEIRLRVIEGRAGTVRRLSFRRRSPRRARRRHTRSSRSVCTGVR